MQPKGVIDFNNQPDTKDANQETVKKLFDEVFSVNQTGTDPDSAPVTEEEKQQEAQEEGHKDFLKEDSKEQEKSLQKLDALTKVAELLLFRTKAINPFNIFPDEMTVDTNKVSIIHRTFFQSASIHSIMITNISDVYVETGLIFARLCITNSGYMGNEVAVEYLGKGAATRARRIIQGLVVAQTENIDFSKLRQELSDEEIIEKIELLGKSRIGS